MKLYVTRHGETPMNAAHRVCGLTNIDLTEKGIAQAKEAGAASKIKASSASSPPRSCAPNTPQGSSQTRLT